MDWTGGKGSREVANIFLHALLDIWGVKKLKVRLGPNFRPQKFKKMAYIKRQYMYGNVSTIKL